MTSRHSIFLFVTAPFTSVFYRNFLSFSSHMFCFLLCFGIYSIYLYNRLQGPQSPEESLLFASVNIKYYLIYNSLISQQYILRYTDNPIFIYNLFIEYFYSYLTYIAPIDNFIIIISLFQFVLYVVSIIIFSTSVAAYFKISYNIILLFCCVNVYTIAPQADLNSSGIACSFLFIVAAILFDDRLQLLHKFLLICASCIAIISLLNIFVLVIPLILLFFLHYFCTTIAPEKSRPIRASMITIRFDYLYYFTSVFTPICLLFYLYTQTNFNDTSRSVYFIYLDSCSAQFHNILLKSDLLSPLTQQNYNPHVINFFDNLLIKLFIFFARISASTYLTSISPISLFLSVFYSAILMSVVLSYLVINNIYITYNIVSIFLIMCISDVSNFSAINIFTVITSIFSFILLCKLFDNSVSYRRVLYFSILMTFLLSLIMYLYGHLIFNIEFGYDIMYEKIVPCSK